MPAVCFYFQVHQPWRVKRFSLFDIDTRQGYFDDASGTNLDNEWVLKKVANYCYIPANRVMMELLEQHPEFRISFSLSGSFLDQLETFLPEVLESFQELAGTGQVEFLAETYYHSLSSIYSPEEFAYQVDQHRKKIQTLFGQYPQVFRNTELVYNNDIAQLVEPLGFRGILAEGADDVLEWRSPDFVYQPPHAHTLKLLTKNYQLSDDIAFRFSERSWKSWPLTAETFAQWIDQINGSGEVVNLFMDYETFGEHQHKDSGIFDFLRSLPSMVLRHPDNTFVTPTEAITRFPVRGELDVSRITSWADMERDLTAWTGNEMQKTALSEIYALEYDILRSEDTALISDWRRLQTSDHFYYMCTKWFADGDVHAYFSPYENPYEAFTSYMNVIKDMKTRIAHVVTN